MKPFALSVIGLLLLSTSAATASSSDAWEEFRADVKSKCIAAARGLVDKPAAWVDPFGTESHGVSIVSGRAKGGGKKVVFLCVYDKKAQTAEIGGEIDADVLKKQF